MEWDLTRFVEAQDDRSIWKDALKELSAGEKRSHWMWFIFPQLRGLGSSPRADYYGLSGLEEAAAYWAHPVLGARLRQMCETLMRLQSSNTMVIFGWPDNLKFCSCMTLFAHAVPEEPLFCQALEKFFGGRQDTRTLQLLGLPTPDMDA